MKNHKFPEKEHGALVPLKKSAAVLRRMESSAWQFLGCHTV